MDNLFNSFYQQNNNQSVEIEDSTALDQCMDLIFAWCDKLNIPREAVRHQYAYQVWAEANMVTRKYFDFITNSPTNKPTVGDIIVFKQTGGIPVGHVSLETGKSDTMNAVSFDQNWDTLHYYHTDSKGNHIPYCRTVVHPNYYGVIGWLHPVNLITPTKLIPSDKILAITEGPGSDGDKLNSIRALCK